MDVGDLYNWSEASLYEVGLSLSHWRRGEGIVALKDAEYKILILLEVCRELAARQTP